TISTRDWSSDVCSSDLMRSSQIFSVAGLPDVSLRRLAPEEKGGPDRYQVELHGLDVFDPATMEVTHRDGADVPAWFLDTAYTGEIGRASCRARSCRWVC